jgi:hypothetical protein
MGFGGPENASKGGAATRKPGAIELLRDRVESEIDVWLAPFADALCAEDRNGKPDHAVRIRAAEAILDRAFGKPAQRAELGRQDQVTSQRWRVDEATEARIDAEIERHIEETAELRRLVEAKG